MSPDVSSGNVHTDAMHAGSPNGITLDSDLPDATILSRHAAWAKASGARSRTAAVVQINHPGRQEPAGSSKGGFFNKAIAPSAVPIDIGSGLIACAARKIIFGTPREMSVEEIKQVVGQFARAARFAADGGFDGVQIHGAHGYLVAQFLSAKSNLRTDDYGGTPENRARIVVEIIHAVQEAVKGKDKFCVGIKLNSVDHQSKGELKDCIAQMRLIADAGVDFIEVSGGSFEDPQVRDFCGNGKHARMVAD